MQINKSNTFIYIKQQNLARNSNVLNCFNLNTTQTPIIKENIHIKLQTSVLLPHIDHFILKWQNARHFEPFLPREEM